MHDFIFKNSAATFLVANKELKPNLTAIFSYAVQSWLVLMFDAAFCHFSSLAMSLVIKFLTNESTY